MSAQDALRRHMAKPQMRLAHLIWHAVRDKWEIMDDGQRLRYRDKFPEWIPPRPSKDAAGDVTLGHGAGLDFLLMHRSMLHHANEILTKNGGQPIKGWEEPPEADDPQFPAVQVDKLGHTCAAKQDDVWKDFLGKTSELLSSESLEGMCLDKLGTRLEYGMHAAMHERFGGYAFDGSKQDFRLSSSNLTTPIPKRYSEPWYDSLLDAYGAHVNMTFWQIHGWVDRQIDRWEEFNGPKPNWSTWMGPMQDVHEAMTTGVGPDEVRALTMRMTEAQQMLNAVGGGYFRVADLPPRDPDSEGGDATQR